MRWGTALLIGQLGWTAPASAQDGGDERIVATNSLIDLKWEAPEDCPTREDVLDSIRVPAGRRGRLSATARISRHSEGYELQLKTQQSGEQGERTLTASECAELGEVTAALLSLALNSSASEPETPASVLRPETPAPLGPVWRTWTDLGVRTATGVLPKQSVSPLVRVGLESEHTRVEFGAHGTGVVRQNDVGPGASRYFSVAGLIAACSLWGTRMRWGPCVEFEVGVLSGRSEDITKTSQSVQPWVTPRAAFHLGFAQQSWALAFRPHVAVPVVRPRFVVQPYGTVFQPARVVPGAEVFASLRF